MLAVCGAGRAGSRGLLHLLVNQPNVPVAVFDTRAVKLLVAHKWREFGKGTFLREVFAFAVQIESWQTLAVVVAQHGGDAVADLVPWQAVAGVLLAASSLTWLAALAEECLPLTPRTDISQKREIDSTFIWHVAFGWVKDSKDNSRTQWSPLGAIWRLGVRFYERCNSNDCVGIVNVLLWFLVILPGYYAVALAAHCGPLTAACYMLGASVTGLVDLEPTSVAGVSIAVLAALTALYIDQEIRQLVGGTDLSKRCEEATSNPFITSSYPTFLRVLCALPYLVYTALHLLWIAAAELDRSSPVRLLERSRRHHADPQLRCHRACDSPLRRGLHDAGLRCQHAAAVATRRRNAERIRLDRQVREHVVCRDERYAGKPQTIYRWWLFIAGFCLRGRSACCSPS